MQLEKDAHDEHMTHREQGIARLKAGHTQMFPRQADGPTQIGTSVVTETQGVKETLKAPPDGFMQWKQYKKVFGGKLRKKDKHSEFTFQGVSGVRIPWDRIPEPRPPGMWTLEKDCHGRAVCGGVDRLY
jgi:hypothetical protein